MNSECPNTSPFPFQGPSKSTNIHSQSLTWNLNMMVSKIRIYFPRGWFSGSILNFKGVATLTPASCSWWHTLSAIPSTSRRSTSTLDAKVEMTRGSKFELYIFIYIYIIAYVLIKCLIISINCNTHETSIWDKLCKDCICLNVEQL